jgi:hypothetical protein
VSTRPNIPREPGETKGHYIYRLLCFFAPELKWPSLTTEFAHLLGQLMAEFDTMVPTVDVPAQPQARVGPIQVITTNYFVKADGRTFAVQVATVEPHPHRDGMWQGHVPVPGPRSAYSGVHVCQPGPQGLIHFIGLNTGRPRWRRWLAAVHELVHVAQVHSGAETDEREVHSIAAFLWAEVLNDTSRRID